MEDMLFYLSIFSEQYDALTRMLLSYIDTNLYLQWPSVSLEGISGIIFSLLKISAFSFLFIFGILLALRIFKNEGIVIMPFELPPNGEMKFNGRQISDMLIRELQRIERIRTTNIDVPSVILWQPKIEVTGEGSGPSISPKGQTLEFGVTELGTIGFGSNSLSLSNLIIIFKRICPFSKPISILSGCIGFFGSEVKLTACLEGKESFTWEVGRKFGNSRTSAKHIPYLVRDLAYQIFFEFDKMEQESNISATTWKSFKYLTDALDEYHKFISTGRPLDLWRSRKNCLKALYSERKYANAVEFLKVLGYTYLRLAKECKSAEEKNIEDIINKPSCKESYRDISKELFEKHLKKFQSSEAHFGLGCIYMDAGKNEDAISEFNKATCEDPDDYKSYYYLSVLEKNNDFSREMFIHTVPKDLIGNYYVGLFHESLNDKENAIKKFKEVVALVPQNEIDWNYRGLSLLKLSEIETNLNSEHLNNALNAFQKIIDKDPRDGEAWNYKGVCYFRLKNYEEAVSAFKKASQISPDNELFDDNLFAALDSYHKAVMNESTQLIEDSKEKTNQVRKLQNENKK